MKISEVSKFSILPCTQNRKLGSLGKYCFISNFEIKQYLRCKKMQKGQKINWDKNLKFKMCF